jgi:rhodanese-related sulfurtransferase
MLKRLSWLAIMLVAMMGFWGCSDDTTTPTGDTAFEVMVDAAIEYVNDSADCPGVVSAQTVFDNLDDYTVIDIRGEADYMNGHIPGAYHSTFGTILGDLANTIPSDKPYVVACYTGQSAGHIKIAMEMMGYEEVQSLLWGMSAWSSLVTGTNWATTTMVDDALLVPELTNNNGDLVVNDFPVLTENATTVVADRVAVMLAAGFQGIAYSAIMDNLDDYFVVNYFGLADYEGTGDYGVPGHIPGAFQFTPYASLGADEMLENLPTDKTIVVYCWTGQHSSQITAYLNMLGYDAKSLKYGSNNLFYSDLTGHKWSAGNVMDFALEVGAPATGDFATLAAAGVEYVNDNTDCPGVVSAQTVFDNLDDYTVIDIRGLADYDAGHIPGAYHSGYATIIDDLATTIPSDKPYVVACYTGQSAGHIKLAMEMMGYEDVQSLLWGMSAWSPLVTGTNWATTTMVDDALVNPETLNNNGDLVWEGFPAVTGTLEERIDAVLAAGFQGVAYSAIMDNLDDYFVVNYFGLADYEGTGDYGVPGHIPGAFQYTPYASLDVDQLLGFLPTDQTIVVYCWTGQHSSQITAYLNMLGYDAKSLKYGSNNLFYSDLTGHKWSAGNVMNFELEVTPRLFINEFIASNDTGLQDDFGNFDDWR